MVPFLRRSARSRRSRKERERHAQYLSEVVRELAGKRLLVDVAVLDPAGHAGGTVVFDAPATEPPVSRTPVCARWDAERGWSVSVGQGDRAGGRRRAWMRGHATPPAREVADFVARAVESER